MRSSSIVWALFALGCAVAPRDPPPPDTRQQTSQRALVTKPVVAEAPALPKPDEKACSPLAAPAPERVPDVLKAPIPPIERADTLAPFFETLAAVERKRPETIARIGMWGDSNLTLDEISGALRRALQARFGDGGHGYIGFGTPRRGYRHMDVRRTMAGWWEGYIYTRDAIPKRGGYGSAGMAVMTAGRGSRIRVQTAEPGSPVGEKASRFGVFHLEQPGGGRFAVEVDGAEKVVVDTAADAESVALELVRVEDAPHRFEIASLAEKKQQVHLYGAFLERDVAGVVVDSYGVTGATLGWLSRVDATSVRPMLEKRRLDLVVFALGTNFSDSDQNAAGLAKLVALHRSIDAKQPILVVTPPDHVKTATSMRSDPRVVHVVRQLREAAEKEGVAFWDFREAMGGDGSMWLFLQRGLAGKDLYHLTSAGARIMGARFAHALMVAHQEHVARHPEAGCAAPAK